MTILSAFSDMTRLVTACGDDAKAQRYQTTVTRKPDGSLVTNMDQAIEARLVAHIRANYPDHAILGEEGTLVGDSDLMRHEYLWVIDPIDGTSAYAGTLTGWCVGVGLLSYGRPVAGIVHVPMSEELYVATPDGGAFRNDTPIHATKRPTPHLDTWIAIPSDCHRKYHITYRGRTRTTGATILSLCYVAAGMASAALVGRCKAWDIAPALALLHHAGAQLWDLDGQVIDVAHYLHPQHTTPTMISAADGQFATYRALIEKR